MCKYFLGLPVALILAWSCAHPRNEVEQPTTQDVTSFVEDHPSSLILFSGSGCPFCDYVDPIFSAVKKQYPTLNMKKVSINNDRENLTKKFKFKTIPTFMYFKNGQQVFSHGSNNKTLTEQQLKDYVERYLMQ